MEFEKTTIEGLFIIKPRIFSDERGYFYESYNKAFFEKNDLDLDFIQDNQSLSHKGVLRGLHFQAPPFAQGKLVRVIRGSVLDVAVDIRSHSPTYGKYESVLLSGENKTQLWIPAGFAHGFVTLEDNTIFSYKCTGPYSKESEGALLWNDLQLNIDWNIEQPIVSSKDQEAELFKHFKSPF
ncbi:MAG: dTDP-4-dehydrorhamnose 3,5-epimerase [Flavobacteriales bacterium]|tara:strand:- start:986 stop:1528 length:543 start_codon:yes stop_codon:yes gene_type:complete